MVQLAIQKCIDKEAFCNEFYLQLIKQTTDQPGRYLTSYTLLPLPYTFVEPNGRINIQNWRFLALVCGVVVPRNKVILDYLQAHLRRCSIDAHSEEGRFAQFCVQVCSNHGLYGQL